jgi:hypothetical protein
MLQYTGAFRFIYSMKETALSDGADIIGQIADEHTDCIALYAAIMAIGKVGGNIAHLQACTTQGCSRSSGTFSRPIRSESRKWG